MHRVILRSGIHLATLTGKVLDYEGSIAPDRRLMAAADLRPGEQVHVLNVNTGFRLVTHLREAPSGSGTRMRNGPAARLGEPGDLAIILAYGHYTDAPARRLRPNSVRVARNNQPLSRRAPKPSK